MILPVENFGPRFVGDVALADKITFRKPHTTAVRTSQARSVRWRASFGLAGSRLG